MPLHLRQCTRFVVATALLSTLIAVRAAPIAPTAEIRPGENAALQQEARLIVDLLQNHHYAGHPLSSIEAKDIIDHYARVLDPDALVFTRDDVEFFHTRFNRSLKTVYLFRGNLQPAFDIFALFQQRMNERAAWIEGRLATPLDIHTASPAEASSEDKPLPYVGATELDARWTRRLRGQVIGAMLSGLSQTAAEIQVARRHRDWYQNVDQADALEIRESFLNVVLTQFDPHSGYFSADSAEVFDEMMGATVVGVGIGIARHKERWTVAGMHPGGPADLSGVIARGDILEAVAEGDGDWRPLVSLRFRDVASALRGPVDSTCRLKLRDADNDSAYEATLQRTRLILPSQRARGAVFSFAASSGTLRIGCINLPAFYGNGINDTANASASRDIRDIIEQMKVDGVAGIILDLRQNPGGAIVEAVSLAELFIPSADAVLSRGLDGNVAALAPSGTVAIYAGPLLVMVSEESASASELLSAVLQQRGRAIVTGAARTFGKATIQSYIDLADLPGLSKDESHSNWGVLRLTAQLFFRPDGTPIQLSGVASDLILPSRPGASTKREKDLPLALPAAAVQPPQGAIPPPPEAGTRTSPDEIKRLNELLQERVEQLPEFALWVREEALHASMASRDPATLSFVDAGVAYSAFERERIALHQERRRLAALGFAAQIVWRDVAEVAAARTAHASALTQASASGAPTRVNHLHRGLFVAPNHDGSVSEMWMAQMDFPAYLDDVEALANSAGEAAGMKIEPSTIARLLRALVSMRALDDAQILACVQTQLDIVGSGNDAAQKILDAILARCMDLDEVTRRPENVMDFGLRENLRIMTDLVTLRSETPPPSAERPRPEVP